MTDPAISNWSGWLDSNQRPLASKASTLHRLSYTQMDLPVGLEPTCCGFAVRRLASSATASWGVTGNRTLVFRFTAGRSATELVTPLAGRRGIEPR